jgi:hypothetical protein
MAARDHLSPQFGTGATHPWGHPDPGYAELLPAAHKFIAEDQGVKPRHVHISYVERNPRHDPSVSPETGWDRRVPTHLVHAVYDDPALGPLHSTYGISTKHAYIRHLDSEPYYGGGRNN